MNHKEDIRTLFFTLFYFLSLIISWLFFGIKWYWDIIFVLLNCNLAFICATIIHNCIHAPVFKNQIANQVFQVILTFTHGHPVSGILSSHSLGHHEYLATQKDFFRTSNVRFRLNFLNQLLFFAIVAIPILRGERLFYRKFSRKYPEWARQYMLEVILTLVIKVLLTAVNFWAALFLLWLPHLYSAWGIVGANYWQHDGCDAKHPYNHSRNFTGKLFNFLVFNNGYHAAHHIDPSIHWSELPDYHAKNIQPYNHPALNQPNFFVYLIKTYLWPAKRLDLYGR